MTGATQLQCAVAGRDRLIDIDAAKGLGMLFVVFGHLVQANSPGESAWYVWTRGVIYSFHMPFFMYLSGFVFFLTGGHASLRSRYGKLVRSRADRLLVPFVAFGLVVVLGKYYAARFGEVHDAVKSIPAGIWDVLSNGPENPSISIWYLVVLFSYCVFMPVIWVAARGRWWPVLTLGLVLHFLPLPESFYLRRIATFFVFFCAGGLASTYRDAYYTLIRRHWAGLFAAFVAVVVLVGRARYGLLYCGLLSLPALHGLILRTQMQGSALLLGVGAASMAIYLMNTIFIGVAKLVWLRGLPALGAWNVPYIFTLMVIGTFGPMIVRLVVQRLPALFWARRYLA